jgi:hypothetical protein
VTPDRRPEPSARAGTWSYDGNPPVWVRWEVHPSWHHATITVQESAAGGVVETVILRVEGRQQSASVALRPDVHVRLTLDLADGIVTLRIEVPLPGRRPFTTILALWSADGGSVCPVPPPCPGPSPDPSPVPRPDPHPPDPGRTLGSVPVIARRCPPSQEILADPLRWVRLAHPETLALYTALAAATADPTTNPSKPDLAAKFRASGAFLASLSALPTPMDRVGALRTALLGLHGEAGCEVLPRLVHEILGLTVHELLTSDAWRTAAGDLWQSVFALALAGDASTARLGDDLVDALRTINFVAVLADGDARLRTRHWRDVAFDAPVIVPDVCAIWSPALAAPPPAPTGKGWWEVAGVAMVGHLVSVEVGRAAGPIAEIVGVLPGERRSRGETAVDEIERDERRETTRESSSHRARATSTQADTTRALRERLTADISAWNLSSLTSSYSDLQLLVGGTWAGGGVAGDRGWEDVARFVASLAERSTADLAESSLAVRRDRTRQRFERRAESVIDNTSGTTPIRGVYRWVDRLVQLRTEPVGPRLILAFGIDQPGAAWLKKLEAAPPVPLDPLPAWGPPAVAGAATPPPVGDWTDVTDQNYLVWGAALGLCDLAPKPAVPTPTLVLDEATPGARGVVEIPAGFAANAVEIRLAVSDGTSDLACLVAGKWHKLPAASTLALEMDASTSGAIAKTTLGQPLVSTAGTDTTPIVPLLAGTLPVVVVTGAPRYQVALTFTCEALSTTLPIPATVDWQVRTWQRLREAWVSKSLAWHHALGERIRGATEVGPDEVERAVLREACLDLLATNGIPGSVAPDGTRGWLRAMDGALDWADASWTCASGPVGAPSPALDESWERDPVGRGGTPIPRFITAGSAQVLVPLRPAERRVLSYLAFATAWWGGSDHAPLPEGMVPMLAALHAEGHPPREPTLPGIVRIPTTLLELEPFCDRSG